MYIESVGIAAPGLPSWADASATLRGERAYLHAPLPPHTPAMLPPNERRRATPTIRLAFQAAEDAMKATALPAANLATVFATSDADAAIIHRICLALTAMPRNISPTEFMNSVHNAAAGYWSIAAGAQAASTTVCAHDGSFASGLFEACLQVGADDCDLLLVAYDLPGPEPLHAKRPLSDPAAVALIVTKKPTSNSLATLDCSLTTDTETILPESALEQLRLGNPAARALPLLQRVATRRFGAVILPMGEDTHLRVELGSP